MAKFHSELPNDLMKVFEDLETNCEDMFGEMCKAGAQVVYARVKANMGKVFKSTKSLDKGLKITRVYKTPSDDGINTKVGFWGYYKDKTFTFITKVPPVAVLIKKACGIRRPCLRRNKHSKSFKNNS